MSIVTTAMAAQRASPSSAKKDVSVAAFFPSAAHTIRPDSWSVTVVTYWWPLRYDNSSMPIAMRPSSGSSGRCRCLTRATIRPTVTQATRNISCTEVWSHRWTRKPTASSKGVVKRAVVLSHHGTASATTPQTRQDTRRSPYRTYTRTPPKSR